jgi:LPPG:FO 2-phospho-L-lactate transferase
MLRALSLVMPAEDLVAIVNTGDDLELYGLSISPDLDTVVYTLAGAINEDTGSEPWPVTACRPGSGLATGI